MNTRFKNAFGVSYETDNWLDFDDILIHPGFSEYESSDDSKINTSTQLGNNILLKTPFIVKNCDVARANEINSYGGFGILKRSWDSISDLTTAVSQVNNLGITIGINGNDLTIIENIVKIVNKPFLVYVESDNAENFKTQVQISSLSKNFGGKINIMVGNVSNPSTVVGHINAGANIITIGSNNKNVRLPDVNSLIMARRAINYTKTNASILSDTSTNNCGKALACGADGIISDSTHWETNTVIKSGLSYLRNEMFYAGATKINDLFNSCFLVEKPREFKF